MFTWIVEQDKAKNLRIVPLQGLGKSQRLHDDVNRWDFPPDGHHERVERKQLALVPGAQAVLRVRYGAQSLQRGY